MLLPVGRSWVAVVAGYFGLLSLVVFPAPIAFLLGIAAVFHIKIQASTAWGEPSSRS